MRQLPHSSCMPSDTGPPPWRRLSTPLRALPTTRHARRSLRRRSVPSQPIAARLATGVTIFCVQRFQRLIVEREVSDQVLQPSTHKRLYAARFADVQAAVLALLAMVHCSLMPFRRMTSRIFAPASTSRSMPMIRSSVNRLFRIGPPRGGLPQSATQVPGNRSRNNRRTSARIRPREEGAWSFPL